MLLSFEEWESRADLVYPIASGEYRIILKLTEISVKTSEFISNTVSGADGTEFVEAVRAL